MSPLFASEQHIQWRESRSTNQAKESAKGQSLEPGSEFVQRSHPMGLMANYNERTKSHGERHDETIPMLSLTSSTSKRKAEELVISPPPVKRHRSIFRNAVIPDGGSHHSPLKTPPLRWGNSPRHPSTKKFGGQLDSSPILISGTRTERSPAPFKVNCFDLNTGRTIRRGDSRSSGLKAKLSTGGSNATDDFKTPKIYNGYQRSRLSDKTLSATSVPQKCSQCRKSTSTSYDPIIKCVTCSRRFHESCRKPAIGAKATGESMTTGWQCYRCKEKNRRFPLEETPSEEIPLEFARPARPELRNDADRPHQNKRNDECNALESFGEGIQREDKPHDNEKSAPSFHNRPNHGNSSSVVDTISTARREVPVVIDLTQESDEEQVDLMLDESTLIDDTSNMEPRDSRVSGTSQNEIPNTPTQRSSQILIPLKSPQHLLQQDGYPLSSIPTEGHTLDGSQQPAPSKFLCAVCKQQCILAKDGLNSMCHRCKKSKSIMLENNPTRTIPETPYHTGINEQDATEEQPAPATNDEVGAQSWIQNPLAIVKPKAIWNVSQPAPSYDRSKFSDETGSVHEPRDNVDMLPMAMDYEMQPIQNLAKNKESKVMSDTGSGTTFMSGPERRSSADASHMEDESDATSMEDGNPSCNPDRAEEVMEKSTLPGETSRESILAAPPEAYCSNTAPLERNQNTKSNEVLATPDIAVHQQSPEHLSFDHPSELDIDTLVKQGSSFVSGINSYKELIALTMLANPDTPLTCGQMVDWMASKFPGKYRKGVGSWEKSVSAVLSTSKNKIFFRKVIVDGDKLSRWTFTSDRAKADFKRGFLHSKHPCISRESSSVSTTDSGPLMNRIGRTTRAEGTVSSRIKDALRRTRSESSRSHIVSHKDVEEIEYPQIRSGEEVLQALQSMQSLLSRTSITDDIRTAKSQLDRIIAFSKQQKQENQAVGRDLTPVKTGKTPLDEMTKEQIEQRVAKIKQRTSRKAMFGKVLGNKGRFEHISDRKSRGSRAFDPDQSSDSEQETLDSLRKLKIREAVPVEDRDISEDDYPANPIFVLHEGQLAVRDRSQANGGWPSAKVFKLS